MFALDIDDCTASSCKNGATCLDGVNSFNCQCAKGYYGDKCENGKSSSSTQLNDTASPLNEMLKADRLLYMAHVVKIG